MMERNQHVQEETQEDINARLALISQAVEKKLLNKQQASPREGETVAQEQNVLVVSACPIDPMERLLCESCQ
jgi:Fic family protein